MNYSSNHHTAEQLEKFLADNYNQSITDLRNHAERSGCELLIRHNGIFLARPGLNRAEKLEIPTDRDDIFLAKIYQDIPLIADQLWSETTTKPKRQNP